MCQIDCGLRCVGTDCQTKSVLLCFVYQCRYYLTCILLLYSKLCMNTSLHVNCHKTCVDFIHKMIVYKFKTHFNISARWPNGQKAGIAFSAVRRLLVNIPLDTYIFILNFSGFSPSSLLGKGTCTHESAQSEERQQIPHALRV